MTELFTGVGEVEIRFGSRPSEKGAVDGWGSPFQDRDVIAVSYLPVGTLDAIAALPRSTGGVVLLRDAIIEIESEGLRTSYRFDQSGFGDAAPEPTAFFIPPGVEHLVPHVIRGGIWVYHTVKAPLETAGLGSEAFELSKKVIERLTRTAYPPHAGGELDTACRVAQAKLASALACDEKDLVVREVLAGQSKGTFVCRFDYDDGTYRVDVHYLGKEYAASGIVREAR